MAEIVGVRFKNVGKIYYFDPGGKKIEVGESVVVETARGIELGDVVIPNRMVDDKIIVPPLKRVMRIASAADIKQAETNREKEKQAFDICFEKIKENNLDMKLVNVEYTFDGNKILFYFTADGRIDFRDLVKDLASVFRTRIELRQIGVRDEAKMLGGMGICGRGLCCSSFLGEFVPVSIKMAKEQSLSLNPTKISGTCGRLMCCLKYEQAVYDDLLKITPKPEAIVETPRGRGVVLSADTLKGTAKVKIDKDSSVEIFDVDKIKIIKNAHIELNNEDISMLKDLEDK